MISIDKAIDIIRDTAVTDQLPNRVRAMKAGRILAKRIEELEADLLATTLDECKYREKWSKAANDLDVAREEIKELKSGTTTYHYQTLSDEEIAKLEEKGADDE